MFTGIIEEVGTIKNILHKGNNLQLSIAADKILKDISLGDSISVNGVCLTVTRFTESYFNVDVSPETYNITNLKFLKTFSKVNLEPALTLSKPLGGHIVSGHVDAVGKIISVKKINEFLEIVVEFPEKIGKYMIEKGSIAIDGISLTINALSKNSLSLMIIPHTLGNTTLIEKKVGEIVNIEVDLIAKYIENFVKKYNNKNGISKEFLSLHGFV